VLIANAIITILVYSQEKPKQVIDVTVKDLDKHVMDRPVKEEERPSNKILPEVVMTDDEIKKVSDSTVQQPTTSKASRVVEVTTKHITVKEDTTKAPKFCDITNGDALSAINRASSVSCKNMIRNVTCLAQEGKLYNMDIPNLCTLGTNPGVNVESLSFSKNDNNSVRILFLMSLHGRSARQVKRLFKAIYHSDHYYYIHVDSVS